MKKKIFAVILMLTMSLCLFACGKTESTGTENNSTKQTSSDVADENQSSSSDEEEPVDDGKVLYRVTVVDEDQTPIEGAMVQLCKDACVPAKTDADGVAEFNLEEDEYKVSFLTLPEGYAYSTDEEAFYFEEGSTELTIVLKKEA